MTPFSIFLCGIALVCDLVYPFVLLAVKKTEIVLPSSRRMSGELKDTDEKGDT
jgi:hypothetical protein